MDFSTSLETLHQILNKLPITILGSNYGKYLQYWPILVIGFIFALLLTPILGQIANKYGIVYKPQEKRQGQNHDNPEKAMHNGIIPGLGGIAIILPVIIAIPIFFKLDSFTIPILVALSILFIGAILDEVINLPAKVQFAYQILSALIIAFSIIDLSEITLLSETPISLEFFSWQFSLLGIQQSLIFPGDFILLFWILVCINAFKWTGGTPGLIESNSIVIYALIFVIAIRSHSIFAATTSILVVGSLIAFLIYALPPPKIFSGSPGRTTYGFLICILALIADTKMATTIMLLILPLIDFIYVIIKRYITYRPKNPLELLKFNDTTHLHHQLLKMNLTKTEVILVETSAVLILSSFAVLTTGALRYFAVIFATAVSIGFVVYINIKSHKKQKKETKEESPESKYSY